MAMSPYEASAFQALRVDLSDMEKRVSALETEITSLTGIFAKVAELDAQYTTLAEQLAALAAKLG